MTIPFNKYQGTGNDFIIIDNRENLFNPDDSQLIKRLCDRRFGIGADGLILVSKEEGYDYRMIYFNSDGNESSMCGNGGRCTAAFALKNGIATKTQRFMAYDGVHEAQCEKDITRLKMSDVSNPKIIDGYYFINTGSPHYVIFVDDVMKTDVFNRGRQTRQSENFAPAGTNVNFAEMTDTGIFVRTYERGVEDETLSCGTGVTASAIATALSGKRQPGTIEVKTLGGTLSVNFEVSGNRISNIWLCGPATYVYEGFIEI